MARIYLNIIRFLNFGIFSLSHLFARLSNAFFAACLLLTVALFPVIYSHIPPLLYSVLAYVTILSIIYRSFRGTKWPKLRETDRQIELANDYHDQPLALLQDNLVNPDAARNALFESFKDKLVRRLTKMRLSSPFFMSAHKDPYGLRAVIIICFIITASFYGVNETTARLKHIFIPSFAYVADQDGQVTSLARVEIQPPRYTGRNIRLIQGRGILPEKLQIAEESTIKITIKKGWFAPKLYIDGQETPLSIAQDDDLDNAKSFYTYSYNVGQADKDDTAHSLAIKTFFIPRFNLEYVLIDDLRPRLTIAPDFTVQNNGTLKFMASFDDDYGTSALDIFMDLPVDFQDEPPLGQPYSEERSFLYEAGSHKDIPVFVNLTRHTYAGYDAQITFNLRDAAGQLSDTVSIPLNLPERNFTEDIAKRIYALRKFIIHEKLAYPTHIYSSLSTFATDPAVMGQDILAKLALTVARERILREQSTATLDFLVDILWRTALRLDKGEFMQSQQDLQDAINALNKVLNDPNASQDERLKAMQNLQNALANYFYEAQKEALRRMQDEDMTFMPQMSVPSPNNSALMDFLNQLEDSALNDPDKAKEMLNALEKALNNLNNNMQAELPQDVQQMMQVMQDMDKIIQQQSDLLDKSRLQQDYESHMRMIEQRQSRGNDAGEGTAEDDEESFSNLEQLFQSLDMPNPEIHDNKGQPNPHNGETPPPTNMKPAMDVIMESGTQRNIQDQLQKMTDNMPMVPDELKEADKHMGNSATYLQHERLEKSIVEQEKILDSLNQKRDQMQQAFEERLKQFAKDNNIRFSFDPLGRANGDNGLGRSLRSEEYDLPEKGRARYIDEILNELRSKAGDLERPKLEREYYKRLLNQW